MKYKYLLRVGLAFVFLFAGVDALWHPGNWVGFIPAWATTFGVSSALVLKGHAIFEILLGILLLLDWQVRFVAALAALDLLGIIFGNGISYGLLLTTFRDVSILFTALYLALDRS